MLTWAGFGVVGWVVEWSLLTPEIRGSNRVIGNFIYFQLYLNCNEKTKINKKEAGIGPNKKKQCAHFMKSQIALSRTSFFKDGFSSTMSCSGGMRKRRSRTGLGNWPAYALMASVTCIGVAAKALKHLSSTFFVAICLSWMAKISFLYRFYLINGRKCKLCGFYGNYKINELSYKILQNI